MQPARSQPRPPGSFSPLPPGAATPVDPSRPRPRRVESSSSDDTSPVAVANLKGRNFAAAHSQHSVTPIFTSFTQHPNSSASSLHNFSRPTPPALATAAAAAARQVAANNDGSRAGSPLTLPSGTPKGHARKHSQTAGLFDSTLPSTSTSNLSHVGMTVPPPQHRELSASHIAAQAAVMQHQSQQQLQQQQQQQHHHPHHHVRQRSQTVPVHGESYDGYNPAAKRGSGGTPLSPPMLSLTEASAPRDSGFGNQAYHNGLYGSHAAAAQAAANVAFPRSGQTSPSIQTQMQIPQPPPPPPPPPPEKKPEKSKVKLFSRPKKIDTKGEPKEKPLPSPSKIGSALASLQRGNFSTTSLDSTAQSFYSLGNSSAATIRPLDTPTEKEAKEGKEKRHYFLSRQKNKLKDKDDFHLPLSSASSNSRPTDPTAPSSLYNFNLPPSPGPTTTTFKSMSGLDLRHGGRALREKKKEEKNEAAESSLTLSSDWQASSLGSATQSSMFLHEPLDSGKLGLNSSMGYDDAWPWLKAKLLAIFQGEDLRLPVEDFNRVVMAHLQFCVQRRSPNIILEDLRELLSTGFSALDNNLRRTPEDRLIPALVELWLFTFASILPYLQAVFLPLDLEFSGAGSLLTPEQSRDFWGGVRAAVPPAETPRAAHSISVSPVSSVFDVRRLVLTSYRDTIILPRYETLKTIFSRLSLEFLPQSLAGLALASPLPIQIQPQQQQQAMDFPAGYGYGYGYNGAGGGPPSFLSTSPGADSTGSFPRPGTAVSLDPSVASYTSSGTTLLGGDSAGSGGSRSRAISNVSFGSAGADPPRPFTPSSSLQVLGAGSGLAPPAALPGTSTLSLGAGAAPGAAAAAGVGGGSLREQNVEDSKQVTEMVGRMLQCMSVLAGVGVAEDGSDEGNKMVEELSRLLKLNWLGRGRTGRNRRGIVGGRVKRGGQAAAAVAAVEPLFVREEVAAV